MTLPLEEQALLTTLLTQPHRKYHNINHINACLVELSNFDTPANLLPQQLGVNRGEDNFRLIQKVEYAIWYHDVVYNPYSKTNEEDSAEVFSNYHAHTGIFDGVDRWEIRDIILATKRHTETQKDISLSTQVMLDIDLSGFGKSRMEFALNGMNIRHEYYNTSLLDFLVGRRRFYDALMLRPTLYYTSHFHSLYNEQAKENLRWEYLLLIKSLSDNNLGLWCREMEAATEEY